LTSTVVKIWSQKVTLASIHICNSGIMQRFHVRRDGSIFLSVRWQSFLWTFTCCVIEHNSINFSFVVKVLVVHWLIAVGMNSNSSWIKLIVFAIDNFFLMDYIVVHVWIIMVPVLVILNMCFQVISFLDFLFFNRGRFSHWALFSGRRGFLFRKCSVENSSISRTHWTS